MGIRIEDNSEKKISVLLSTSKNKELTKNEIKELSDYQGKTISELCKNNPHLLVFPHSIGSTRENDYSEDKIGRSPIFSIKGSLTKEKIENASIKTYNLFGYIGTGNSILNIDSRFSNKNFFMLYMFEKVFSVNIFKLPHKIIDGNIDLLPFLFPYMLKRAFRKGVFREYVRFKHNDIKFKGALDISRHIRLNNPFKGYIAYSSRDRTYDNHVMHLIRLTVEHLKRCGYEYVIKDSNETRQFISMLYELTPSFINYTGDSIINKNHRPVSSPLYREFRELQNLCLKILCHKKSNFDEESSNRLFGILFDGSWLWESYLRTVLTDGPFTYSDNLNDINPIYMFKNDRRTKRYPDFYRGEQTDCDSQNIERTNFILDAKYKKIGCFNEKNEWTHSSIQREDLHQIVTYLHIFPALNGGFIYPYKLNNQSDVQTTHNCSDNYLEIKISDEKEIRGLGGKITTYGIPIPKADSYESFHSSMEKVEKLIKEEFKASNAETETETETETVPITSRVAE